MNRAFAVAFLLATAGGASAYIEALYPLAQFIAEAEVVAEGTIEKVDPKTKTAIVKVTKSLKGKCTYEQVRMNIGSGAEWFPEVTMRHLVVGAPAVIFYNAERRAEIYVNRFFLQFYGDAAAPADKAWFTYTHVEVRCNRTFNGTAEELAKLVTDIQAGKAKAPPPDPKLPVITRDALMKLPVWGEPVNPEKLPPCFAKRDPTKAPKPRDPENPANVAKGLAFEYFEGAWNELPDFDAVKPVATGTAEQFGLERRKRDEQFGFRFTGFLEVPKDGVYTFFTVSDDGSKLFIGKTEVVSNDGLHAPQEAAGEIALKAGKHAIAVTFFENSGGEQLDVLWEGPDLPRQKIPPSALFRSTP